jgi:hypothetical protein
MNYNPVGALSESARGRGRFWPFVLRVSDVDNAAHHSAGMAQSRRFSF